MKSLYIRFCVAVLLGGTALALAQDISDAAPPDRLRGDKGAQIAALHDLQAAFHRATTVRDPANGDSDDVINERIRAMLSLWTGDGWLLLGIGGPRDGYYIANGDPANPSTCPAPSDNSANRGTLCTFFKYVAPPFQPANRLVSLAPAYKTQIHVNGYDATLYFECHLFNVAMDPATGKPLWSAASHLAVDGAAVRAGNHWLFWHANVSVAGIPLP